jgi:hypothetical protein
MNPQGPEQDRPGAIHGRRRWVAVALVLPFYLLLTGLRWLRDGLAAGAVALGRSLASEVAMIGRFLGRVLGAIGSRLGAVTGQIAVALGLAAAMFAISLRSVGRWAGSVVGPLLTILRAGVDALGSASLFVVRIPLRWSWLGIAAVTDAAIAAFGVIAPVFEPPTRVAWQLAAASVNTARRAIRAVAIAVRRLLGIIVHGLGTVIRTVTDALGSAAVVIGRVLSSLASTIGAALRAVGLVLLALREAVARLVGPVLRTIGRWTAAAIQPIAAGVRRAAALLRVVLDGAANLVHTAGRWAIGLARIIGASLGRPFGAILASVAAATRDLSRAVRQGRDAARLIVRGTMESIRRMFGRLV